MKENSKFLRRSTAWLFTAGVLAAVIVLNLVLTLALGNKMTVDLTTEGFNEISTKSRAELDKIDPKESSITIYFLADLDELNSAELGYSASMTGSSTNLWGMKYISSLASVYAELYDFVSVDTLNIKKDADKLEEFKSTVNTSFTKQDVIVDNYTGELDSDGNIVTDENGNPIMHHNFRRYTRDSFFIFDSSSGYAYGFKGDQVMTAAILAVSGKNPTAYFVGGHGEEIGDDSRLDASVFSDYGRAGALRDLLFNAGFVTKKIDLSTDYSALFEDDTARVIIVFGPSSDYVGANADERTDEIAVVRKFMNGEGHSAMFFVDDVSNMPNLSEYLVDYYGVTVEGTRVKDGGANSLSSDGYIFISDYETDEYGVGTNLTDPFADMTSQPFAVFSNAATLKITDAFAQNSGFHDDSVTTTTGGVFVAPKSASGTDGIGGDAIADYSKDDPATLMTLSVIDRIDANDNEITSYALITGSVSFADAEYVNSASYCNGDILYYTMRIMGKSATDYTVDMKKIESFSISGITDTEVVVYTVLLSGLVPVVALTMGSIVFFKRRHK